MSTARPVPSATPYAAERLGIQRATIVKELEQRRQQAMSLVMGGEVEEEEPGEPGT